MAREAISRRLGQRAFDVQLIGAVVLHQGKIAELKTGEGKTLVASLALYLNSLEGKGAHLVTVNDYLSKRDAQWYGRVLAWMGVSVGVLQHDASFLVTAEPVSEEPGAEWLQPCSRRDAYAADATYGTNHEFGFDYLRDNMANSAAAPGSARAPLRHRRRGGQHPHRRGAHAADHQRSVSSGRLDLPTLRGASAAIGA